MKPSILFLDETTSGLDSENAVSIIKLIKEKCLSMNVTAVVVIHQPSYDDFSHFDRLVLLQKGKCVFCDLIDRIPSFYETLAEACQKNISFLATSSALHRYWIVPVALLELCRMSWLRQEESIFLTMLGAESSHRHSLC